MNAIPRGIRNNNPGNIRASKVFTWYGQTGVDADGFCVFDSYLYGLRAMAVTLHNYRDLHHCVTLHDYIRRWAPPDDNDTAAYTRSVAGWMGIKPDTIIDLDHYLPSLMTAIVRQENGIQPYTDPQYQRAIKYARKH